MAGTSSAVANLLSCFVIFVGLIVGPSAAQAMVLTGDTVSINLTAFSDHGTQSVFVGAGEDGDCFNNQFFDFDAGLNNDLFTIRSIQGFSGIDALGGQVTWTLTGLDFAFGSDLIDFIILQNDVAALTTINFLTADSVSFSYDDNFIPEGIYFTGQFTTIPEPSTLALFATGLALLAFIGWRRRPRQRTQAAA